MCVVCDVQSVCNVCAKEARARRLNDTVTLASGWRRIRQYFERHSLGYSTPRTSLARFTHLS